MKKVLLLVVVAVSMSLKINAQDMSNPSFMCGNVGGVSFCGNIGKMMQSFYKVGMYDDMMRYTSAETIKKYGRKRVLDYYMAMEYGYALKLISKHQEGKYTTLNYNATINATNKVLKMKTVVENDTAKVVLDNLTIMQ